MAKKSKKAAAKEKTEEKESPIRKYAGVETGQRLTEWFTHTFQENFESCQSDEELAKMTCKEFPMGKEYGAGDIKTARGRFNKGVLLKNQEEIFVPDSEEDYLPEYDDEGEAKAFRGRGSGDEEEEEAPEKKSKKGKKKTKK